MKVESQLAKLYKTTVVHRKMILHVYPPLLVNSLTVNPLTLNPLKVTSLTVAKENLTDERPDERTEERDDPLGNRGRSLCCPRHPEVS